MARKNEMDRPFGIWTSMKNLEKNKGKDDDTCSICIIASIIAVIILGLSYILQSH